MHDPSSPSLGPASRCAQDRVVWSHNLGKGHGSRLSLPNSGSTTLPGSPDPQLVPRDPALDVVDLTLRDSAASPPSPSPCPLRRDSQGKGSQAIPDQRDPPSEDAEEPAPEDQAEEEEEEQEEKKVLATKVGAAAMGRTRAASKKKSARKTQRR